MQHKEYAEIAVGLPVRKPFHYRTPAGLIDRAEVGRRVWVPFGPRKIVGYITGFVGRPAVEGIKDIISVIDDEPVISAELLSLTRWISEYYHSSWGEAIEAALPGPIKKGKIKAVPRHPAEEERYEPTSRQKPTQEQASALKRISESVSKGEHRVYLLHGITGSGKTEVYMQSIDAALKLGRSAIVLVPEISLTPQTVEWFKARFGGIVAVLHSRLLETERFQEWKKLKEGKAKIAVGARSAVFAPVRDLGLIVIDEEHETSYKQDDAPRYNARDVAIERARLAGAAVILGGATPSVETYRKALDGEYEMLKMKERIEKRSLPKVDIIDMRQELLDVKDARIFSRALEHAVTQALNRGGQVMLFMNRRGFSTFINCRKCGNVIKCRSCSVSMTYHFDTKSLSCHYCGYRTQPPQKCPKCKSGEIQYFGYGTQKIESEAARLFPAARIARMDTDATSRRGSHRQILGDFKKHKIDILIGTQMIAKGHDFPRVMLVGVISADTALNLPDFRSGERTFNLLTQVAGRAGRGEEPGRVIIQTFSPAHYAVEKSVGHDYEGFFAQEIEFRKELGYPPFCHLVEIKLRGRNEEKVIKASQDLASLLRALIEGKDMELEGPAPAFISKIKGQFRWNMFLKARVPAEACVYIDRAIEGMKGRSSVTIVVDVDPLGL